MAEPTEIRINDAAVQLDLDMSAMSRRRNRCMNMRHCNTEYEALIVLEGACEADVEDHRTVLRAGQGILVAPGRYHVMRTLPGPFDHFCFRFLPEEGPLLDQIRVQLPDRRVFAATEEMTHLALTLYDGFAARGLYWRESFVTRLKLLLLEIMGTLRLGSDERAGAADFYTHKRATQIDRYIEENLSGEPDIDGLARALHLSRRQTTRVVQENFGAGFREKLLRARMDRAAWLLRTTRKPLSAVISEVGYSSTSAFYQAFRRQFGMTPLDYRRQAEGL